ncbi:MAG: hypothetical protein CLLPBCKN_008592 [Chroococcidiopsis cubana SAG 39.79]|nr:hypothetical protein [Chroococcidiopsis cubana SAG 39.79]
MTPKGLISRYQTWLLTLLAQIIKTRQDKGFQTILPEKHRSRLNAYYSIRINDQYRICFGWSEAGAIDVEIVDYHS